MSEHQRGTSLDLKTGSSWQDPKTGILAPLGSVQVAPWTAFGATGGAGVVRSWPSKMLLWSLCLFVQPSKFAVKVVPTLGRLKYDKPWPCVHVRVLGHAVQFHGAATLA